MISESAAVLSLLWVGVVGFRGVLWRLGRVGVDYGQVLGIADFDLYHPLLQLHSHRLAIYSVIVFFVDQLLWKSHLWSISIVLLPIVYVTVMKDPLCSALKKHFKQALFMSNNQVTTPLVIFSDVLCSYARLLAITFRILFKDAIFTSSELYGEYICGLLVALPFWIRMRQCLQEASSVHKNTTPTRSLMNALRYATNFPVIFLSFYSTSFAKLWIFTTILNQLFNLYWDCFMDWNLAVMTSTDILLIVSTVLVRVVWAMRAVCPTWFTQPSVHYTVIAAEVVRRMIWMLLRVQSLSCLLDTAV